MHISEGILSAPVLAGGWGISIGLLAYSLKKTELKDLPKAAVFGSAFFIASLIKVPIGASSAHFALLALMGLTLGYAAVPAIFNALFLQAILFQFGGLWALGVNTVIMAVPALVSFWLFQKPCLNYLATHSKSSQPLTFNLNTVKGLFWAFFAGFSAVFFAVVLVFFMLLFSNELLLKTAWLFAFSHLPLAFCEGLVTAFAVGFLAKVSPSLLSTSNFESVTVKGF
ncbi:cobalt transporter CbiM [Desulfovibrio litoralis]|uniref:Cobalt/nickel transport system permease protein n=1 Tax=Desulfovibrio litoralis DSM 11393 TaxID=1121455 RepID=A0A1M7S5R2_9BACT|nr:cobalt transporter CbiM [Desulfovibrio litoralis]SHN54009.1 cobalt/nickel transport system permease protein [Desulfovibrio litoralis DSM 11393]